jgi:YYY domain-containing protein
MSDILRWLLLIEAIGIGALPLAWAALGGRPLGSLACARPLGIALAGALAWICISLRIYPYSERLALVAVAGMALGVWAIWGRGFVRSMRGLSRDDLRLVGVAELIFAGAFAWQAFMVRLNPSVYLSEIPMNFAFVNAINRGQWFPPADPWLAGHALSYYYFGHFLIALLIRLAGVTPAVGFTLAGITLFASVVALIFGIAFESVASLPGARAAVWGVNHKAPALAGAAAVLMALFNGNLAPLARLADEPALVSSWWASGEADWWRLPYHSHGDLSELPWRTYLLHYTHSFDIALPFLLAAFALGMRYWSARHEVASIPGPVFWVALALLWSASSLVSPWVLPAAGLLAGALVLSDALPLVWAARGERPALLRRAGARLAGWAAALGVAWALAWLLSRQYHLPGQGARAWIDASIGASAIPPRTLLLQFGVQITGVALVVLGYARRLRAPLALWLGPAALGLATLVVLGRMGLAAAVFVLLWWSLLLAVVWHSRCYGDVPFSLLLLLVATSLNTLPFFVVVHDSPNTFFKLGFLAWVVASIGLFAELGALWRRGGPSPRWAGRALAAGVAVALFVGAWMPALAAATTTNRLRGWGPPTLDGAAFFLERTFPAETGAVRWLNDHAGAGAVVLEAVGEPFTPAARISTLTGLPAVVGWPTHESLWREGDEAAQHEIAERVSDVRRIYATLDPSEAACLLNKYDVTYVVVGRFERERVALAIGSGQAETALAKFGRFMEVAYPPAGSRHDDATIVYQRTTESYLACLDPARHDA